MIEKLKKIDIIYLLLLIMPFIDILNIIFKVNASLLYRSIFLIILLYKCIFKVKNNFKSKSIFLLSILFTLIFIYMIHYYSINGLFNLKNEFVTLIKFAYLPILTIALFNYFLDKKIDMKDIISKLILIYGILIIIPVIAGISLKTYAYEKLGYCGLFYSPNELSSIIALLTPFAIMYFLNKPKNIINMLNLVLIILSCFLLGTKTPVLSLFISLLFSLILLIIRKILKEKNFKKIIVTILLIISCLFIYEKSYLKYNINYQSNSYNNTQTPIIENYDDKEETQKVSELFLYNQIINFPTQTYNLNIKDNKILNMIFSSRNVYLQRNFNKFKDTTLTKKLYGMTLGSSENNIFESNMSELDMLDILMYYGIVGAIVLLGYLLFFAIKIMINFFKKFKTTIFDYDLCAGCCSLAIGLLISFMAGHTISAPSVSLFIALDLIYIFYKLNFFSKKESKISNKKIIFIISIFILASLLLIFNSKKNIYSITINMENDKLSFNKEVTKVEEQTIHYGEIKDSLYYYVINSYKNVEIIYVNREIPNKNSIQFLTINNNENVNLDITINISSQIEEQIENYFYTNNNETKILSNAYIYNEKIDNIKKFNKYVAKNLINEENNFIIENSNLTKSIYLKNNKSLDLYAINLSNKLNYEKKEIPWLSFSGCYINSENKTYFKNLETLELNYKSEVLNNLLSNNYLMNLYRYANHENGIWYKDYIDENTTEIPINSIYVDSTMNEKIYSILENFKDYDSIANYNDFAKYLRQEYKEGKYLKTSKGIIFNNLTIPSFKNQISNAYILLKDIESNNNYESKTIALKLINDITSNNWIKEEKYIYEYINSDLDYVGQLKDNDVLNILKELNDLLKRQNINNSGLSNYINILERSENSE